MDGDVTMETLEGPHDGRQDLLVTRGSLVAATGVLELDAAWQQKGELPILLRDDVHVTGTVWVFSRTDLVAYGASGHSNLAIQLRIALNMYPELKYIIPYHLSIGKYNTSEGILLRS